VQNKGPGFLGRKKNKRKTQRPAQKQGQKPGKLGYKRTTGEITLLKTEGRRPSPLQGWQPHLARKHPDHITKHSQNTEQFENTEQENTKEEERN